MQIDSLHDLYSDPALDKMILELRAKLLETKVRHTEEILDDRYNHRFRISAIASATTFLADLRVDQWFHQRDELLQEKHQEFESSFAHWRSFLNSFTPESTAIYLDDLLMFAVAGMLARRDHEVRDLMRRPNWRSWLDKEITEIQNKTWPDRVRSNITISILLLIRQASRADLVQGDKLLVQLSEDQKEFDTIWLQERANSSKETSRLLTLYHIAQSVLFMARFLGSGTVEIDGKNVMDFDADLRRLCSRADDFAKINADPELRIWMLNAVIALDTLRATSIWIQARNISEGFQKFVEGLTAENRAQPVFSLLAAQQDALRKSLLDQSRMAIVLQMPTSAGKTMLAEFSIIQTLDAFRGKTRIAYIVPTRALVTQVYRTLAEDLRPLGIEVTAASSAFEEDPFELSLLEEAAGVLVATPEKFDLLMRLNPPWLADLKLTIVDEAHLIQDTHRGPKLELLLANLRREKPDSKLLLLSPFIDNAEQIAKWLNRERFSAISISWRPARVLLGMLEVTRTENTRNAYVHLTNPFRKTEEYPKLTVAEGVRAGDFNTNTKKVLRVAEMFKDFGAELAIYSASPAEAEKAARQRAEMCAKITFEAMDPQLRVAIALARHDFGDDSTLAYCLERGVAFHHSSLSPMLRYLIEHQVRANAIRFIAATSTLAQGMNFPVATVIVHSVHKPRNNGNFSPAEFWNIAGRAGRVGLAEEGLVLFTHPAHQTFLDEYSESLRTSLISALLIALKQINPTTPLKTIYQDYPAIRPLIQYLAHAVATTSVEKAIENLENLIQSSLVYHQIDSEADSQKLRTLSRSYLAELKPSAASLIKVADSTGLGTFSFNELYAKLGNDPILSKGPKEILAKGQEGIAALIEVLKWLPELDLAIGLGQGKMSVNAVATVVQGWIDGKSIRELSNSFPGADKDTKMREAAKYLYGKVSQTVSWGAHAFLKGYAISSSGKSEIAHEHAVLPSFIQYGVQTVEGALTSLLGVPRPLAEATGAAFRDQAGKLLPENSGKLKAFVEEAKPNTWDEIISRSKVNNLTGNDFVTVYRDMQGLTKK